VRKLQQSVATALVDNHRNVATLLFCWLSQLQMKWQGAVMKNVLALKGAQKLVLTGASVQPGEVVTIVTDYECAPVAEVMAQACILVGAETSIVVIEPVTAYGGEPSGIAALAMKSSDVIFTPISKSITHSSAMLTALRAGARALTMSDFSIDLLIHGGIEADFLEIKPQCDRLADLFTRATNGRLTTKLGTDLRFSLEGRSGKSHSCVVRHPGDLSSATGIDANVSPVEGSTYGTVVADASIPYYGIGPLNEPVSYEIENGQVVGISGGRQADEIAELMREFGDVGVYNIAQVSIGLNPRCRNISKLPEAIGRLGTANIGIGTSENLGGSTRAALHYSCFFWRPTLELDGEIIQIDGSLAN
jgi:2,5-dihydroxypyridine 5,6-dioxygenase